MAIPALLAQARTVSLLTNPPSYPIGQGETIPLPIDFTARFASTESIATSTASGSAASAVTVSLTDVRTGLSLPGALSGAASVSTGTLMQTIVGSALTIGRRYKFVAAVKELSTQRVEETVTFVAAVF